MDKRGIILLFAGLLLGGTAVYLVTKPSRPEPVRVVEAQPLPEAKVEEPAPEPLQPSEPEAVDPKKAQPARNTWKTATKPSPSAVSQPGASQTKAAPAPAPSPAPEAPAKPAEQPKPAETARTEPEPVNEKGFQLPVNTDHVAPPPKPQPKSVTLAEGTILTVRVSETLSSEQNLGGDTFQAVLDAPLIIDGYVIAERGARVEGKVVEAWPAGRMKGKARLTLALTRLRTADGQTIPIDTATFLKESESGVKEDAVKVGIGSAIGAAIGAIAGGGKGAAIGAGAGAAAGTGVVLATRGKPATIPAETRLSFKVEKPVVITERLRG